MAKVPSSVALRFSNQLAIHLKYRMKRGERGKFPPKSQKVIFKCSLSYSMFDIITGEPPPSVLWYRDTTIIDKTYIANEKGAVQVGCDWWRAERAEL